MLWWKPETKEALRAWIVEYMREHQKVLSRDLLEAVRRDRRFYRLSPPNTSKLGFIMKGLPEYYYVWKAAPKEQ